MPRVEIFDPPLCCSSGICGPRIDPVLLRINSDLKWLAGRGVTVTRYNLAQQPAAFASNALVQAALTAEPETCLPLVLVDGRIVSKGAYPKRAHFAEWTGLALETGPT